MKVLEEAMDATSCDLHCVYHEICIAWSGIMSNRVFTLTLSVILWHLLRLSLLVWTHLQGSISIAPSPSCFCSGLCFISFVVALSFKSSLHQRFTTRPNGCREICSGVNWSVSARFKPLTVSPAAQLVKSPEASLRMEGTSLVSTANQLAATSPVAKKRRVEQPIGTHTLWN